MMRRVLAILLASSALCMAVLPAAAQNATWLNAPGSGNFNTGTNWDTGTVPTGTAFFDTSGVTALSFAGGTSLGGWTFNAGASAYTFTNGQTLQFTGAGIVINGGSAGITNNNNLFFNNTSTAGNAIINNNFSLRFSNTSTAGSANIANNSGGFLQFNNTSTAGSATIASNSGGSILFHDTSTAGSATIANNSGGTINFRDSSTAGNVTINNDGFTLFLLASTAGSSSIANNSLLQFVNTSTAGNAAITNGASGTADFSQSTGSAGDHKLSAGSLNGGGFFRLGQNELTVGGNNLSTNVTGVIANGGLGGGTGASLVKTGTGTMILSGNNTYTGATTVNGGMLAVNGSIVASSGVTVNGGGMLAGTGTVRNALISGGVFMAGGGTAASSMTVTGTLGFNAASTYLINVNPTTASFANVSGAATLGGATVNAIFANGSYIAKQYTILNAGSISGTFGTLANTNLLANFHDSLSYDATHAYLNLDLTFTTPSANTLSGNQNNVANALINFFNSTGGIPLTFATLSAPALSQASGQPGASTAQTGITGVGQFINATFDGAFGDDPGQGGVTGFAQDYNEANAYAPKSKVSREAPDAFAKAMPVKALASSFASRWAVWASVYGGNSRVNGDTAAGTNTTTSRIFGTVAGASYRFTPDTQAGFALGGAGSSFSLDGGFGGGKADVFNAAAYAKRNWGAAYVAGLLGYSWQDTMTDRSVTIAGTDQLHASFKAQALTVRLEGGWRYATPMVGVTPYTALQTTSFYLPAYGETATSGSSTFALNYASKSVTATRSELGAKFDKAMLVQGGTFTLKAKTVWAHDWNTDRAATATFQTLPGATFIVNGAAPSGNAALVSLGGAMDWHNGWTMAASLDGEFSRTAAGYAGKGSVKYAW